MFFVLRAVFNRRQGSDNPVSQKYRDAVKQPKKQYGKPVTNAEITQKVNEKRRRKTRTYNLFESLYLGGVPLSSCIFFKSSILLSSTLKYVSKSVILSIEFQLK